MICQIESSYFHNVTIFETSDLNNLHQKNKSEIMKFLEREERDVLKFDRYSVRNVDEMLDDKKKVFEMKLRRNSLYDVN